MEVSIRGHYFGMSHDAGNLLQGHALTLQIGNEGVAAAVRAESADPRNHFNRFVLAIAEGPYIVQLGFPFGGPVEISRALYEERNIFVQLWTNAV